MDRRRTQVTLLLPGLESAAAAFADGSADVQLFEERRFRWSEESARPWEVSLQLALGLDVGNTDIPMAQALCAIDEPLPVVCADPIHLKADRDTASLIPAISLDLEESEAAALIASLNEFVRADGFKFELINNESWVLKGITADAPNSFPPHYLADRPISPYLSDASDNGDWRRWQTEWQMLLHNHPINQARSSQGKLPVNSLWLWGAGNLPESIPTSATVYANDANAIALCQRLKASTKPLANLAQLGNEQSPEQIVVLETSLLNAWIMKDADQLKKSLSNINNELIPTLIEAHDKGHLSSLDIVTEDGHRADLQSSKGWLTRLYQALHSK